MPSHANGFLDYQVRSGLWRVYDGAILLPGSSRPDCEDVRAMEEREVIDEVP